MPPNPIGLALRNRRAGQHTLAWARPELIADESFILSSPAFQYGDAIPDRYRGRVFATDISPALTWTAPPPESADLVLIVEDPDAPRRTSAVHALAAGIDPTMSTIPDGGLSNPSPIPDLRHGKGALGRRGWSGPLPPRSHGPHTYVFQLYALEKPLDLPAPFTLADVLPAMAGHVIARARLDGTYEKR